ncbi:MAG: glutathione S-transferase family protein [Lentilitoribacter sp.]
MTDIILHNYPQSPVAEKVRVALGIKKLPWYSVEIPRLAPKPKLTKLTGGYRRTPVMQIGADIYCDTQCILKELERRFPSPTFFPTKDRGLIWSLSRWTDGALFDLAVKIVLGSAGENLPEDFAKDRGRLYFGPDWAEGLKKANADLPHLAAQMRAQMKWLDEELSDGRDFLLGDEPGAIDAQYYYIVWFLNGRWEHGPMFLSEFEHLQNWITKVQALGHGEMKELPPEDAIRIAGETDPQSQNISDQNDPQGLKVGERLVISPDLNGGEQPVEGTLVYADHERITVQRSDADIGDVHVHFPRLGYRADRTS